ncbi:MAG: DinB family protein [Bryobacteraceae bacterium]
MGEHKHDRHEAHRQLVTRLRAQAADAARLISGLDEDAASRRVVSGKWSLKELVCHLWRSQQIFAGRVAAMREQENPQVAPWDPENDSGFAGLTARTAGEAVTAFLADRDRFAALLESLAPADWHRPGRHPEFPHYDVHFQVEYMAFHEAHHLYQMYQRRSIISRIPHA